MRERVSGHIRRNLKGDQFGAEAAGANGPVGDACSHPHKAQHLCRGAEIEPDEGTDEKAQGGRKQSADALALFMPPMMEERSGIHAHEGDKGSEVEALCADLVGASAEAVGKEFQQAGADKRKRPHSENVVAGNTAFGLNGAKK